MNMRDSEATAAALLERGHKLVDSENDADVLIFNTCSVREKAELKALGKIGIMKKLKKKKPHIIIGVMGCMAQNLGEQILQDLPHVDFVIGTGQLHKVPEIIEKELKERSKELLLEADVDVLTGLGSHLQSDNKIFASIAVTRGCNRFCSYCIVPHVRGREISRSIEDVVVETKELASKGVKEIMLLGQNVAAFGLNGDTRAPAADYSPFAELLEEICLIDKIERIRFISPYPSYFNDRLIATMAANKKICNNVHFPLQSGSDRILKAMNRQYSALEYYNAVMKMKEQIADITFSTDIIVGFPGETVEDFEATRQMMEKVQYDNAYIFKYSPRKGTAAAEMNDQISQEVKEKRNQILLAELNKSSTANNLKTVGQTFEVLAEGASKRNSERWSGRTSNNKVAIFEPDEKVFPGELIQFKVDHTTSMSLFGNIVR